MEKNNKQENKKYKFDIKFKYIKEIQQRRGKTKQTN